MYPVIIRLCESYSSPLAPMVNKLLLRFLLSLFIAIGLITTSIQPVSAALPPGNAVKDPYEILRNALPIQQKELREIQHKLEDTNASVRRNQWPTVSKAVSSAQFRVSNRKAEILNTIPSNQKNKAENIFQELKNRKVFHFGYHLPNTV